MFGKSLEQGETRIAEPKLVARSPGRGEPRVHVILRRVRRRRLFGIL